MFRLVRQTGDLEPVELPSGELMLVGRAESCSVVIEDPSASRIHCRVLARDGKVYITDAGSRWGTFVNGRRVDDCELRPGDEITIGETVLRLAATGTPDRTTLARRSEVRQRFPSNEQSMAWPTSPDVVVSGPVTADDRCAAAGDKEPDRAGENGGHQARSPSPDGDYEVPASRGSVSARRADLRTQQDQSSAVDGHIRPGQCFAGYQVREHLAKTATGEVFRATRLAAQRGATRKGDVALKVFDPVAACELPVQQRFLRVLDTMAGLRHPNLVALLDAGIEHGRWYTVSEFVDGESAAALIQRIGIVGMLDWRTTLRIASDIAAALEFAAEHSIVHRNITPRNVLIRRSDRVALLNDLLLARSLDEEAAARVTQPGELLGTIPFLSPEQAGSGQPVDHRSDLYQLGAMLYALLTGRPPLGGGSIPETVQAILTERPEPPTRIHLAVPALLEGIILRLLEKRPDDRYRSASVLRRELQRVGTWLGEPPGSD